MKKSTSIFTGIMILCFAVFLSATASAQRGSSRGSYGRGDRGSFGRADRGSYGRSDRGYSGSYHSYSRGYSGYRSPSIIGRHYSSVIVGRNYSPFFYGPRYYGVPHGSLSIMFGGNPYYYYGGSFYQPYGGYYRTIFPPIGIRIGMLPMGYMPIYIGPSEYYYYNGSYYRQYDDRSYEVVDAPMGAQVSSLPSGAKSVVVNGEKFYELNGTYYKEDRNSKGQVVYTVVGKNGEIDNTQEAPVPAPPAAPKEGDNVPQLPTNSKVITLHGEKLYVSPDNTYYRPESDGTFTVVGVSEANTL